MSQLAEVGAAPQEVADRPGAPARRALRGGDPPLVEQPFEVDDPHALGPAPKQLRDERTATGSTTSRLSGPRQYPNGVRPRNNPRATARPCATAQLDRVRSRSHSATDSSIRSTSRPE
jgi:hypothetical protein